MSNGFIYVVDAHFIDKIEEKKSWIQVPVVTIIIAVHVIVFFYVVMYALFVLSVYVYYVNCNAKTQMGYLCALIKYIIIFLFIPVSIYTFSRYSAVLSIL